ncbi:hypothetical protein CRE_14018 [Caenorhabditis remanei]|uniref:C-type lectin domain-containing protein n=1 Tax=Caenorhabditis remanei TaxID=31234 RepID=E3M8U0_CAERE|nr:hypothetical protein CRE_14018 [Caenorhabditis remanei]
MNPSLLLFLSFIGITVSIIVEGGRGGGRGRYDYDSDSSDSHEHRPRPHRPRPPRPQPGRPPRERTNCPANWLLFKRHQGNWCVGTFVHPTMIGVGVSEEQCKSHGAKLTGFQSSEERMRIAEAGRQLVIQNNLVKPSVWVGARNKPECGSRSACPDSRNSFYWTDGHTQNGTDGFGWQAGNPMLEYGYKDVHRVYGISGCVVLSIGRNGVTAYEVWKGFLHGLLDDTWCHSATRLYACGKKAT